MGGKTTFEYEMKQVLARVRKPYRYVGGEFNQTVKDHRAVDIKVALAFPDLYDIGMSYLGFRILYSLLNDREDTVAERVFCPWPDMAAEMRGGRIPLTTLESGLPVREMDLVGFSLQYEMTYTNILEMLDLAGIPLHAADRGEADPLVIAGGPSAVNSEPLAAFLDLVLIGDGELLLPELLDRLKDARRSGARRAETMRALASMDGVYAPSFYDVAKDLDSGLLVPVPTGNLPFPVNRRILLDLERFPFPAEIIVPHGETVHDRVSVEIMRGCPVGCRFCQAGYIYRPKRQRDPNIVRDTVLRSIRATGYDEFSLASLNTGEYGEILPVMFDLMERLGPEMVSTSMASMHASTLTEDLARQIRQVRKSGFTIAPEAGTQRMRDVINKNLDEDQIYNACRLAFEAGWEQIKLYFMIGLPTENDEDVEAQAEMANRILRIGREAAGGRWKRVEVGLSASSFVPKPFTPFQWLGMDRPENLARKQRILKSVSARRVRVRHHDLDTSFLEAVFARGDRALGPVLERAFRGGARFDGWSEHFSRETWDRAFREEGIDPEKYAHDRLNPEGRLPWDVIDVGVGSKWLAGELQRALDGRTRRKCTTEDCHGCGPFAHECVSGVVADGERTKLRPGPQTAGTGVKPVSDAMRYRYRLRYSKGGGLVWLGHLDMIRTIVRSMIRAGLPVLYSKGYNPKARISFGPALGVGIASTGEYLDVELSRRVENESLLERLNASSPGGLRFHAARLVRSGTPALSDTVTAARYMAVDPRGGDVGGMLSAFERRGPVSVVRESKGKCKTFHLRDELLSIETVGRSSFRFVLAVNRSGGSLKPSELISEIMGDLAVGMEVTREELLVDTAGRMANPLLAAAAGVV